jgi:outer membrane protein insertion porin family
MASIFSGKWICRGAAVWCAALLFSNISLAAENDFIVRDIRVQGLQRISEGAIFNYLPINIGDNLTSERIQEAMRAVYATEFFNDVEFRREGDTLIVAVAERPSIIDFTITGNKDIKTEDLEESLAGVGLRKGRILNRSVLDDVERSLTEEYFSQGKYSASVRADVVERGDNTVEINIKIKEGDRARIRQINIVGNSVFNDDELREIFQLRTPHLLSFIRQDDRYSREALQGDLEAVRSYYMDRGYADFNLDSAQVAISPDKKDIFITVNVVEGARYTVSEVKLAGDLILPESSLTPYVQVRPGQIFSQRLLTSSEELIQLRLGEEGYAFTEVEPVTELDKENRAVSVTFYVDPRNRVYVRRVNFNGADAVNDEVFRREMRQFEGGYLSKSKVDRSRTRLQRLPYIEAVDVDTKPVPGTSDMVDVEFNITEGLPGQFGGGLGYSDSQGILLNGNFVHTNFMGTGNRIQADLNLGKFTKVIGASYTNPYVSLNEVSRTVNAAYRKSTQFTSDSSDLDTTTLSAGINWGYPLSEYQRVNFGFNFQLSELAANTISSSEQALEWIRNNGDQDVSCVPNCGDDNGYLIFTTNYKTVELATGWSFDSRNRSLFATRGAKHSLGFSVTVPGSEVEYLSMNYRYTHYLPFTRYFLFALRANVGYGEALGSTTSIPPYKNFYSGGPNSVRGFGESSLGPLDSLNNPYGGNLLAVGNVELVLPIPVKWQSRSRFTLFYDIGNVYSTEDSIDWFDAGGTAGNLLPKDFYAFDFDTLRQSTGIAAEWLSPMGLFKFSYALPLNEFAGGNFGGFRLLPDDTEKFQFTIGGAF